jgi:hypothetical protein
MYIVPLKMTDDERIAPLFAAQPEDEEMEEVEA